MFVTAGERGRGRRRDEEDAGAQDHAQAATMTDDRDGRDGDSGSDGVRETTAQWRQAEQKSAANARRLRDRAQAEQRQELLAAKMRSINTENETELDPGYMRQVRRFR